MAKMKTKKEKTWKCKPCKKAGKACPCPTCGMKHSNCGCGCKHDNEAQPETATKE